MFPELILMENTRSKDLVNSERLQDTILKVSNTKKKPVETYLSQNHGQLILEYIQEL